MIRNFLGAGCAAIVLAVVSSVSIFTAAAQAAPACEQLFKSESSVTTEGRVADRDLKARFSIDTDTKQTRVETFVKIRGDRELYVDFLKPEPGKPIVVLVNGLTYRTGIWDAFVEQLKGEGVGILRYDPKGMGQTMERDGYPTESIELIDQVKDLNSLLNSLKIKNPVHLVGLSYGSAISTLFASIYPKRIESLVLMSPYTEALEAQDNQINMQVAIARLAFPYNPATNDQLYDYFLRQIVYATYPISEPIILEHPYKLEAVFRMAQGVRKFRADAVVNSLPAGKVHLVVAQKDQYIPQEVLERFWSVVPKKARASRMILDDSEHKIPEMWPHFSAEWIKLIVKKDPRIQSGETWEGGTWAGGVKDAKTKVEIKIKPQTK